jgi:hypothetical protein
MSRAAGSICRSYCLFQLFFSGREEERARRINQEIAQSLGALILSVHIKAGCSWTKEHVALDVRFDGEDVWEKTKLRSSGRRCRPRGERSACSE